MRNCTARIRSATSMRTRVAPAARLVSAALIVVSAAGALTAEEPPAFLVLTETEGYRHDSISAGVEMLLDLSARHGYAVEHAADSRGFFTDERLSRYDAVVFLSTTGDVLDPAEQDALERFVRAGGGFVGIHAAADTEHDWPWYGELVGARFRSHPAIQAAVVETADREHPSTRMLPSRWTRTDEWYDFDRDPRARAHVLLTLDEATYEGGAHGGDHPIAWCAERDGGRVWYTGLGHTPESYDEPLFREHVHGGLRWAGRLPE